MNIKQRLTLSISVSILREKALSGMMAAAGRGDTGVKELEELIRQKSVSDIAVQTTTEEGLVPLPVSGTTNYLFTFTLTVPRLAGRHVQHPMVMCSMLITVSGSGKRACK